MGGEYSSSATLQTTDPFADKMDFEQYSEDRGGQEGEGVVRIGGSTGG